MKKEEILSNYIEKILNIQDEALTEEHLKEIALELGLDEAAYRELQEVYAADMERGEAFMKHGNWNEAISEFQHALAINPLKVEALMALSATYEEKWKKTRKNVCRKEAIFYARRALKFDPDHTLAIEAIGRIQKGNVSKSRNARIWIISMLILLIGGLFITFRAFKEKTKDYSGNASDTLSSEEQLGGKLAEDGSVVFTNFDVPIRFDKKGTSELALIPSISAFKARKLDYTYHLQGWLQILEGEVNTIVLEIKMLLKDGTSYSIKELRVFSKGSLPARTGDKIPFGSIIFQDKANPDNIAEVLILIHEMGKVQAPESYEPSIPLEVGWVKEANKEIAIEAEVRTYELKTEGFFPHAILAIEAKNVGKVPISVLEFQVDWLDKSGKPVHSDHQFLISSYSPALVPGETYISSRTYSLTKAPWQKIASYRINIVRAWK